MTTIRRAYTVTVATITSLVAALVVGPAAFAYVQPPGADATSTTVSHHTSTVTSSGGGMLGWQITLIAVGAALIAALLTAGVDRFTFYRRLAHQAV